MLKRARLILEIFLVTASAAGGWLFALRTEKLLSLTLSGAYWFYSADDNVTRVVLVGSGILLIGLMLLMAQLEKRGKLTPERRRLILLGVFAAAAFVLAFEGVLEFRNPEKFTPY